jgi:hypothetical protein
MVKKLTKILRFDRLNVFGSFRSMSVNINGESDRLRRHQTFFISLF